MKKLVLVFIAVLFLAGMTSCKKDYNCACTFENHPELNVTYTYKNSTKKGAEADCDIANTNAGTSKGTCALN